MLNSLKLFMRTFELKKRLELALERLLPLFEVTIDEFVKFEEYFIRRKLKDNEFPKHSRFIPAYNFDENYFYFPNRKVVLLEWCDPFKEFSFFHEMGHYVHNMINHNNRIWLTVLRNTGKYPPGVMALRECVADYPCFVLDIVPDDDKFLLRDSDLVYTKFGSNFLPRLARIGLDEARSLGVIE